MPARSIRRWLTISASAGTSFCVAMKKLEDLMAATASSTAARGRSGRVWTVLVAVYAAVILFPVIWMVLMAFKPADAMFARPTVWLFEPSTQHLAYVIDQ